MPKPSPSPHPAFVLRNALPDFRTEEVGAQLLQHRLRRLPRNNPPQQDLNLFWFPRPNPAHSSTAPGVPLAFWKPPFVRGD